MPADKSIPARPNLDQYRKQAKDLVKDWESRVPQALERIRRHHPRVRDLSEAELPRAAFTLADAQLVIAREHAFKTWPDFARHLAGLRQLHAPEAYVTSIEAEGVQLQADVSGSRSAHGVVLIAQVGGRPSRAATRHVANELNRASFLTVISDLLTAEEAIRDAESETLQFDIRLLARRVLAITSWVRCQPTLSRLPIACFSSGTGAAASLLAVAERPDVMRALVSSAGRPDLAGPWLWKVRAPTLFLLGTLNNTIALGFTKSVMTTMARDAGNTLELIEGTADLFAEKPLLEVTRRACSWFRTHLAVEGLRHE